MMLIIAVIGYAPWQVLAILALAAALFATHEFRKMLAGNPAVPLPRIALLGCVALIHAGGPLAGAAGQSAMLGLSMLIWMAACLLGGGGDHSQTVQRMGLGSFALIWIGWFFAHWPLIIRLDDGSKWGIYLLFVLTGSDIMAYAAGSLIGRHGLLTRISPNKTVEGLLGALMGGVLGGALAAYWLPWFQLQVHVPWLIILSVLLATVGQLGDFVASLVERMAGVKDSGAFLPGHGGFIDRLDSLLLAPALLYYILVLDIL